MANTTAHSSKTSGNKIHNRIESLLRAEESYYQGKNITIKQARNTIIGTLRDSTKQRLLSAIKQNLHRFSDLEMDSTTSAEKLENDCYKKYEKNGKSIYLSQMASTVRWLSSASSDEVSKRLGLNSEVGTSKAASDETSSQLSSPTDPVVMRVIDEKVSGGIQPEGSDSPDKVPPPILSFSEFINSRKASEKQVWSSKRKSSDGNGKDMEQEKKTRHM